MSNPSDSVIRHPRSPEARRTRPFEANVWTITLTIVAAAATMAALHWGREAFIPIVLSVLISYALEPVVAWLTRLRVPRLVASAVVVGMMTASLGYIAYSLADDVAAIVAELPDAATKLRQAVRRELGAPGAIQHVQQAAEEFQRAADEAAGTAPPRPGVQRVQVEQPAFNLREYLSWGSASAIAFAGQATLIIFFVFFLLASGDLFKRKLVKLAGPSPEKKRATVQILDEINAQIERFLVVYVVGSIVVGVATWMAFRAVGLEQAAVWGLAAGIFNSIPYFGPVIVAGGTAVVAFLQFGTITMALYVAGISLAITTLEGWLLIPWLTRRAMHINEVAVFVGLIFWSFVWGIWGTLLAVPLLVAVKAVCDRVENLKPVGELLGK